MSTIQYLLILAKIGFGAAENASSNVWIAPTNPRTHLGQLNIHAFLMLSLRLKILFTLGFGRKLCSTLWLAETNSGWTPDTNVSWRRCPARASAVSTHRALTLIFTDQMLKLGKILFFFVTLIFLLLLVFLKFLKHLHLQNTLVFQN